MLQRNPLGDLSGNGTAVINQGINLGIAGAKLGGAAGLFGGTASGAGAGVAGGGLSLGALALPIVGVGLAALPFAMNLAQCGTLTTIGCTKVSDSTAIINVRLACCQIAYAWEQGQITSSQAVGYLQQLEQEAAGSFQRPTDWTSPSTFYTCCGSFTNNGTAESGPPCSSGAATLIPSGTSISGPDMINKFIAYVSGPPPAGSPAASTSSAAIPGGATIGALETNVEQAVGTNWPLLAVLAIGAWAVFS